MNIDILNAYCGPRFQLLMVTQVIIIVCLDHIWLSVVNISYINCIETYTLVEVSSGAPMPGESLKWIGYIFTSVDMLNDYV